MSTIALLTDQPAYVEANLSITVRPISVAANAQTKVYGDGDPSPLTYKITGGSLAFSDTFTGALTRAAGESVATYAIGQGTLSLGSNYALTFAGANLTITPRSITVTASAPTKRYGSPDPPLTYLGTKGALVTADAFSGALSRASGEDAGAYPIIQGTLAPSGNYTLSSVGATLTIMQATPTLPGTQTSSSTYGVETTLSVTITPATGGGTPTGSVTFQFTSQGMTNNICADDSLQAQNPPPATPCSINLVNGTATVQTHNLPAGTTAGSVAATYSGDANYVGGEATSINVSVSHASTKSALEITPTAPTCGDSVHLKAIVGDNTDNSVGMPTGRVQFSYRRAPAAAWTNIGPAVGVVNGVAELDTAALPAGNVTVQVSYAGDANFLASNKGVTQTVKSKALTVTGITAQDQVYDAAMTATPNATGAALAGVLSGDVVTLDASGAAASGANLVITARNSTGRQSIFNISTKRQNSNNTYVYLITLNDGSTIQLQYGLK